MGVVGQPLRGVAIEVRFRDGPEDALDEPVPVARQARDLVLHLVGHDVHGLGEAHDGGEVLRARAQAALLAPAQDDGAHPHALADVEHAQALGAVDVVGGEGHEVHPVPTHVEGQQALRRHGVGVEGDALSLDHLTDLGHGLDSAHLVAGVALMKNHLT